MIPGNSEFVGIRLLELDRDAGVLRLELALDDGSIATTWWPLDDIHPEAISVERCELDDKAGVLRIQFALGNVGHEVQHWPVARLRQFMGVRDTVRYAPARPMLQQKSLATPRAGADPAA